MKEKIQSYVQIMSGNVELNIAVKEDLKKQDGNLSNFGYIQVTDGGIESKNCFWDSIPFFFQISFADFKKECGKELKEKGYPVEETYKDVKRLLKRARKLNLITE